MSSGGLRVSFRCRDIKKRAVRKRLWVAFTALSHLDDVSGEDCTGSGRIGFGWRRSLAVLKPSPSILKRILQDTDLVRTKFVWRKMREKAPHGRLPTSDGFYTSVRFKLIYRKLVRDSADCFLSQALIIERAVIFASSRVPQTVLSSGKLLPGR